MKTIYELRAELNRWLAFRWMTADHGGELPGEAAFITYVRKLLDTASESLTGSNAMHRIRDQRAKNGLPETSADLSVLCAIDVKVTPDSDGADDKRVLRVVTGIDEPSEATLATLPLKLASIKDDGMSFNAVVSVDAQEDAQLSDLFVDACRIQDSVDTDIAERWMRKNANFRERHPICPVCCAAISDPKADRHLYCGCCGWVSHREYYCQDELAEESAFRSERNFLAKIKAFDEKRDAALAKINEGVSELEVICAKPVKGHNVLPTLEREAASIVKRLTKIIGGPIKPI